MKKASDILMYFGGLMILAAAIMKPMLIEFRYHPVAPWIMAIGVVLVIIYRIINPLKGSDKKRITRLQMQLFFSSLAYCFSVYLLYNNDSRWVVTLLIAAIIDLVVIFRLPSQQ